MSDEIINLEGLEYVNVSGSTHASREKNIRLEFSRNIQSITCGAGNQAALANAEAIDGLLQRARRSADKEKIQLLQLIRSVENGYENYTRDLENEMHRLRNLSGAYNAANEQAERKDKVA